MHPTSEWANPDLEAVHDAREAQALLDRAGIVDTDGDGIREAGGRPLSFGLIVYATEPDRIRAAELMREMVAEVGIEFRVESLEFQTVDDRVEGGDSELAIPWLTPPFQTDPDTLRRFFASDGDRNQTGYSNAEFDRLASEQSRTVDQQERRRIVFRIQEILARDVPTVVYYHSDLIHPYRTTAVADWAFVQGVGIYDKTALLESTAVGEERREPEAEAEEAEAERSVLPVVLVVLGIVAVAALAVLGWRRARGGLQG